MSLHDRRVLLHNKKATYNACGKGIKQYCNSVLIHALEIAWMDNFSSNNYLITCVIFFT
uniref:Uncharacterized protein n=1 Tax=virus sp. ctmTa7 TaxID=2828255 RepID=A0A8S5RCS1_9VIRU|nr:MAG TPA: hypothetical protein [virus sp. ctmTa7]DAU18285.1 MAG TPA: hypothetical protein [Bacteriophage sp.]